MIRIALLSLALAATAACTTTPSGSSALTVPAGRASTIDSVSVFDPTTCRNNRLPNVRFVQPENGRVTTRPTSFALRPNTVRERKCAGSTVRGLEIVYTPKPGFRGADPFTARISYETLPGRRRTSNRTYPVTVR